jgi:DNA primase
MIHPKIRREIAERYHHALPDDIRASLKGRGIPSTIIERQFLGWNGERITIPIFGREREVLGFRYAKSPDDSSDAPAMLSDIGLNAELYGWETLARHPHRVVIAATEFDRLVLEANGFPAVASTAGAGTFLEKWLPSFEPVRHVYVCFARDLPGSAAARKIQRLMPQARIVTLPPEVGKSGTVTDFFAGLGCTKIDFEVLLAAAEGNAGDTQKKAPKVVKFQPLHKSVRRRAERVKRAVRLHDIVAQTTDLQASGSSLVGHCPFHDDHGRSFTVHPTTDTYSCAGCGAHGDVVQFLMDKESMTIGQALEALEGFQYTHELYGTS